MRPNGLVECILALLVIIGPILVIKAIDFASFCLASFTLSSPLCVTLYVFQCKCEPCCERRG